HDILLHWRVVPMQKATRQVYYNLYGLIDIYALLCIFDR
ncbi:MAG: hypothetical protein ACI9N9_000777, partial [Enterobacterales bacterium]